MHSSLPSTSAKPAYAPCLLPNPDQPLLTVKETAALLNVSVSSVRRMIKNHTINAVRINGSWRIQQALLRQQFNF